MRNHPAISQRASGLAVLTWLMSPAGCDGDTKCGLPGGNTDAAPAASNQDGGADATPVANVPFATALASTYCDSIAACCRQAGDDASLCRSTLEPYLTAGFTVLMQDSRMTFDEAGADGCLSAYRAALSACTDQDLERQINVACKDIFRGNVPMGGSCASDNHCLRPATGYAVCWSGVCSQTAENPNGPWLETTHLTAGQACNGTCSGSSCNGTAWCWTEDGLYCESGFCAAVPTIGQPCAGNYCEDSGHCQSGMCVADEAAGPCTSDYDCLATSYCTGTPQACTPRKPNGDSCSYERECLGGQCELGRCRTWSMATPAACAGLLE